MAQYLISHRGTIAGVQDEFTHTLVVSGDGGSEQAVAETAAEHWITQAWNSASGSIRAATSSTVLYTEIAVAEILSLVDGTLSAAYHHELDPLGGLNGTGTDQVAQVATCVSLTAGTRPNGVPLRGRFYLPVPSPSALGDEGLFTEGYCEDIAAAVSAYTTALETDGLLAGVWSRTTASFNTLTQIRVGDHPDTIRTRRNATPEIYVVA